MKITLYLSLIITLSFIYACAKTEGGKSSEETRGGYSQGHASSDPYPINSKSIIFYMITQEEFDSAMAKTNSDIEGYELNDSIADFDSWAGVIRGKLAGTDIKTESVRHRFFKIKANNGEILFDRKKNDKYFGVILSDGNKDPLIKEGIIFKEEDYRKMIKEYFGAEVPK